MGLLNRLFGTKKDRTGPIQTNGQNAPKGESGKRKALPKNFGELVEAKDIDALKAVLEKCEPNAIGGYSKGTALHFPKLPDGIARWLVGQGADPNARDLYGKTPLHGSCNIGLLLELGADIEAQNPLGETPLHSAATRHDLDAARSLIAHGANVNAKSKRGYTPLSILLGTCQNADIADCARIAALMLEAGAKAEGGMARSVTRIGEDFEFFRESFNEDYLEETEQGLAMLYGLFKVTPVKRRVMNDGTAPISVAAKGWQQQHAELWNLLVPASGACRTVQGEVIRITGRVAHEIMDNGAVNWDSDFSMMLAALEVHFASGAALPAMELAETGSLARLPEDSIGERETERLSELAVKWVLSNPIPMPLGERAYRR